MEEIKPYNIEKVAKIVESKETMRLLNCLQTLELHAVSIGEGGNADVFVAEETPFKKVCLKKIKQKPQILSNDIDQEHKYQIMAREAGVSTPLPLISFEAEGKKYLIMERVDGHTILEVLEKPSLLPKKFDFAVFSKALDDSIKKMHDSGLYHRDLHSKNVMINKAGMPVIIDFGTATVGSGSDFTYEESVSMYNPTSDRYEQKTGYFKDDLMMVRNLKASLSKVSAY